MENGCRPGTKMRLIGLTKLCPQQSVKTAEKWRFGSQMVQNGSKHP
jgi:hypothetical protein